MNINLTGIRWYSKGSDYGASKAGVIALTKCAVRELAGKGIWSNAIAP
jgi:NAD(P)-dependent dehydrogenase (short-subunit alcohol dehydrogenase family)